MFNKMTMLKAFRKESKWGRKRFPENGNGIKKGFLFVWNAWYFLI